MMPMESDGSRPVHQHLKSEVDRLAELVSVLRTQLQLALPLGGSVPAASLGGPMHPCPYIQTRVPLFSTTASSFVELTRAYIHGLKKEAGYVQYVWARRHRDAGIGMGSGEGSLGSYRMHWLGLGLPSPECDACSVRQRGPAGRSVVDDGGAGGCGRHGVAHRRRCGCAPPQRSLPPVSAGHHAAHPRHRVRVDVDPAGQLARALCAVVNADLCGGSALKRGAMSLCPVPLCYPPTFPDQPSSACPFRTRSARCLV